MRERGKERDREETEERETEISRHTEIQRRRKVGRERENKDANNADISINPVHFNLQVSRTVLSPLPIIPKKIDHSLASRQALGDPQDSQSNKRQGALQPMRRAVEHALPWRRLPLLVCLPLWITGQTARATITQL